MNKRTAFTLLELLIAIALASFIMLGMFKLYQGVVRYTQNVRNMMSVNRKVCLLFNQLERDLTSAYIPTLSKKEKMANEAKDTTSQRQGVQAQTSDDQKKEDEKAKELRKTFFVASRENDRGDIFSLRFPDDQAQQHLTALQVFQ